MSITRTVLFAPTIIEDDAPVGGNSVVASGVHIKRGAVIGVCSYVESGIIDGENEFWAGIPARKIKDLEPASTSSAPKPWPRGVTRSPGVPRRTRPFQSSGVFVCARFGEATGRTVIVVVEDRTCRSLVRLHGLEVTGGWR